MTIESSIIHTPVTLTEEIDAASEQVDFTMEMVMDERFEAFLTNISEDGLNTTRDTYFNGMQALVDILNAVYDDQNPEVSLLDALTLVEDALISKAEEGEIDLSYSSLDDKEEDANGLYDDDDDFIPADDDDDEEDEEFEEEDDRFED